MSLPSDLASWIVCPKCGSARGLRRLGPTGVPLSAYGKRRRTVDSDLIKCDECKATFRGRSGTMFENMGLDRNGENLP